MTPLTIAMQPQPTPTSCGPTALHAVYDFWGDGIPLSDVIEQAHVLEEGGTLAVLLGIHALSRGYVAELHSYNLTLLDPTWFGPDVDLRAKLAQQRPFLAGRKSQLACDAYTRFLELGGRVHMEDLTSELVQRHLAAGRPMLAGVSGTYLYGSARELADGSPDDLKGAPQGHFVVVHGLDGQNVSIADPWPQPDGAAGHYTVTASRFINAVLLGVLTYDGNLLVLSKEG